MAFFGCLYEEKRKQIIQHMNKYKAIKLLQLYQTDLIIKSYDQIRYLGIVKVYQTV